MVEQKIYTKVEEILTMSDHIEGLAFVLYDSMTNGMGETDRKLSGAASLLSDEATEIRERLENLAHECRILKKGDGAA